MGLWCAGSEAFAIVIVPLKECLVSPVVVDKRSCDNGTAVAVCCFPMIVLMRWCCAFVSTEGILVFSV